MNVASRFNTLAVLTVYVGLVTFALADGRPGLAALSTVATLAGWFAGRGGGGWRPATLPRTLVNLLVLGAIINAAMQASRARAGQPIVSHLGEFLVYVQLLKLFDRRTPRDESQLLTLSVFVVIAATLTSNSLPVGLALLVYTPLAVMTAMTYQLRAGIRRALGGRAPSPESPPPLYSGRRPVVHLRRVALASLAAAAGLAAVVFVLTPRGLGANALGHFGEARVTQIGFNGNIQLGQAGFLQENSTPVLDLAVEDANGNNLGSPDRVYYLRGVTRDYYSEGDRIWQRSREAMQVGDLTVHPGPEGAEFGEPDRESSRGSRIVQRITLRQTGRPDPVYFSIWRPLWIAVPRGAEVTVDGADATLRRSAGGDTSYTIQSSTTDGQAGPPPPFPKAFQQEGDPVRALAVSTLQRAHVEIDPARRDRAANRQAASLLRDMLQRRCTYSRELEKPPDGVDPIVYFLIDENGRKGHCEYFASAMVALCQSVGLPARLVAGYVAADFNTVSGKYTVRQSNAHAWVEYHVGDGVWQSIDPSPPGEVAALHPRARGWFAALRNWYDTLEFGWNRSIIGFDADQQKRSTVGKSLRFDRLSRWYEDITGRLMVFASESRARQRGVAPWLFPVIAAGTLVLFVVRRRGALLRRRSRADRSPRPRGAAVPGAAFYRRALRLLDRAGLAKPPGTPPLWHAASLESRTHPAGAPLADITRLYYRSRFAGEQLSADDLERAREGLQRLKGAASAGPRRGGDNRSGV